MHSKLFHPLRHLPSHLKKKVNIAYKVIVGISGLHVEARGQRSGVFSLLPWNPDHQVWTCSLLTEPPQRPSNGFYSDISCITYSNLSLGT